MHRLYWMFVILGAFGLITGSAALFTNVELAGQPASVLNTQATRVREMTSAAINAISTTSAALSSGGLASSSVALGIEPRASAPKKTAATTSPANPVSASSTSEKTVSRTKNSSSPPPLAIADLNAAARGALVNILCESERPPVPSTSGSGVIIDSRGIILTNAHVAQYFLLKNRSEVSVSCIIRGGSPAKALWSAELLYVPPSWIQEHGTDILASHPLGTGEHDYALLRITETLNGSPLPLSFPYLSIDSREATGFTGDSALIAAYPAEFITGAGTRNDLNVVSTISQIQQMLTFSERLVDAISLGGSAVAQSGSSGGAVVNLWGNLIGLVVTTSDGDTTASRDLRAVTTAHIDRSIEQHTGKGLHEFLQKDTSGLASDFAAQHIPALSQILIDTITAGSH